MNKAVLRLELRNVVCVAIWTLVMYSNQFHWNCVEIASTCKKLLFSGALYGTGCMFAFTLYNYTVNNNYIRMICMV